MEGDTYPPPRINEILSNVVFVLRMVFLILLLAGPDALRSIGIQNPPWFYVWAQENKVESSFTVIQTPFIPLSIFQSVSL